MGARNAKTGLSHLRCIAMFDAALQGIGCYTRGHYVLMERENYWMQ